MSSAAVFFLASPGTLQSRCSRSPTVGSKDYWYARSTGGRDYQWISSRQSVGRVETKNGSLEGTKQDRAVAAKAGLGRYSGAVHGNFLQRKPHVRRPPLQQDEEQDSIGGSENDPQNEGKSGETTLEEGEQVSCGNDSSEGSQGDSPDLAYKRYLQEIGVNQKVQSGGGFGGSAEATDDLSIGRNVVVSDNAQVQDTNASKQTGSNGQGEADEGGLKNLNREEARESKSGQGRNGKYTSGVTECGSETGKTFSDESDPLPATVIPGPDYSPESSIPQVSETDAVRNGIQSVERDTRTEASVDLRSVSAERMTVDDGEKLNSGLANVSKKQSKNTPKNIAGSLSLKIREIDDGQCVRVVEGGAEQPVNSPGLPECDSERTPAKGLGMVVNVSVSTLDGDLEPEFEVKTEEGPKQGARFKNEAGRFSMVDPRNNEGQGVEGTDITVEGSFCTKTDFNIAKDTSNEAKPTELHPQDRRLFFVGNAGADVMSLSPVAVDEQEELSFSGGNVRAGVMALLPPAATEQEEHTLSRVASVVLEQAAQVVDQVVDQVVEILPESVTEQVGVVVDQVTDVAEQVANTVNEQVLHVAENVSSTASQVAEQVTSSVESVTSSTSQVVEKVTDLIAAAASAATFDDDDDGSDSDDEFEAYKTSDLPEFRGKQGLGNFIVKQENQGVLFRIYDLYSYMLKQPLPKFAMAMFSAPIVVSAVFTLLYLPQCDGMAFDDTARDFFSQSGGEAATLQISWKAVFQVFMFSLSLSTGLQPDLTPLSPYTLVVANVNALVAQLIFVFLSGAVFARLSQPSQPVRCSSVALVSTSPAQRRRKGSAIKVLLARYVLAGPQPCELVDVKVDLSYKYNTYTRTGSYFRATQPLKLVRPEIAFLTHGMLIRHVIDDRSPLYQRTQEMLKHEDAVFCLSVVGLERASMQPVFHVQHYCVVDDDIIWDAEFEDLILINKKNRRVVDHSRLSMWRPLRN